MGFNSSSAYLFGSQSLRAGSDRPWWPVRCVLLSVTSPQSSLYFLFQEMNLFFVAFQAFQSHAASHQWTTKTFRGKEKPKFISNTTFYIFLYRSSSNSLSPGQHQLAFAVISDGAEGHVGGAGVYLNSCATSQGQHLTRVGPGTFYTVPFITIHCHVQTF